MLKNKVNLNHQAFEKIKSGPGTQLKWDSLLPYGLTNSRVPYAMSMCMSVKL